MSHMRVSTHAAAAAATGGAEQPVPGDSACAIWGANPRWIARTAARPRLGATKQKAWPAWAWARLPRMSAPVPSSDYVEGNYEPINGQGLGKGSRCVGGPNARHTRWNPLSGFPRGFLIPRIRDLKMDSPVAGAFSQVGAKKRCNARIAS